MKIAPMDKALKRKKKSKTLDFWSLSQQTWKKQYNLNNSTFKKETEEYHFTL